jgi:sec-independent protein translocase protein TatC
MGFFNKDTENTDNNTEKNIIKNNNAGDNNIENTAKNNFNSASDDAYNKNDTGGKNIIDSKSIADDKDGTDKNGAKGKKKNGEKEMSFIDHIEELRRRIIVVLIIFAVAFIPAYIYHNKILQFLMYPLENKKLIFLEVLEPFLVNVKLAFFGAAIVAIPVLVYQIIIFIKPALSRRIRRSLFPLTIIFFILFAGGIIFSYKLMVPISLRWLLNQGANLSQNLSVNKYISFVGWFLLGSGIVFELPLILLFLIKVNILTVPQLRRQWRVVYIVILLICAIITPDWSPVTMGVLAVPMILLYELSLLLARFF